MRHVPTEESRAKVKTMASCGVNLVAIAKHLGINFRTLRSHYDDEIETAELDKNIEVSKFLFHAASGRALSDGATYADCLRAAMFYAKTRMEWSDVSKHEVTGKDGGPIQSEDVKLDPSKLDNETLANLVAAKKAADESGEGEE